jgi:drug/metabolite transporter (DMT)-like permease
MAALCDPRTMDRRSWIMLGVLASVWGASYLFIKIGLEDFSPAMVVFLRTLLAAVVLAPLAFHRGAMRGLRPLLWPIVLLAAIQVAVPFLLISWGEEEISSSLAGILVASAPILTALLAVFIDHEERPSAAGGLGIGIGIVGVGLLLGVDVGGDSAALIGGLAVILASLGYAIGGFYLKARFKETQPIGVVTATMFGLVSERYPRRWPRRRDGRARRGRDRPGIRDLLHADRRRGPREGVDCRLHSARVRGDLRRGVPR